jgi:hypothetical protein
MYNEKKKEEKKEEVNMFCLKEYDMPLLYFSFSDDPIDGQSCHISKICKNNETFLPLGMEVSDKGLMSWLRHRIIPKNREFVNQFLAKNNLSQNDTRGILEISKGLSLNDSYWVVKETFTGKFADYNLYENNFVKTLSLIAYTGYGSSRKTGFSSSPEFTTGGMLRKGWRRINGKTYLYKGGTSGASNSGNEPYNEFYASQIAEKMGINHVSYDLAKWKGCLCSTCELFTDIDHSYIPIYKLVKDCSLRNIANYCKSLGKQFYDDFVNMLIFDALIYNEDRHFGNFGMIIDNKTNKPCAFAPIFDNGLSLFCYADQSEMENLDVYSKTRLSAYGISFDAIAKEFITPQQKEKLRKMIGFSFTKNKNYNLSAKKLKIIEKFLQKRIQYILNL